MKIVCESCGAKYSIADDRVVGKMFKIRCKKCSEVIVVRGDQPQAAAEAQAPEPSAAGTAGQSAIWHIVVDGEQAGPYTPAQLADMLTSGSVDWEAYVWCEGFDNWLPMRDVPDLVALITGQSQPHAAAAAPAAAYRSQQATLTGQPSMGADPFAEDSSGNDSGMFGAQAASADLFARNPAQAAASSFADDPGVVSSSPSPRLSAERVLTGARNENSVLFSLKNLQSLATGSGTPSGPPFGASASAGGAAAERGGFASGEGSGLIDIRALASTTGIGESNSGNKDELLSIGSQGGAFGTLGSPMMAAGRDDGDGSKKMLIWAGVVGVALLCCAGVAVAWLLRPQAPIATTATVGVAPAVAPTAAAAAAAPAPVAAPAPTAAPTEGELAAAKAASAAQAAAKTDDGESRSGSSRRKHESSGSAPKSAEPAAAEEPKKAPPTKSGPRSIDDLLDGALSGNSSGKTAKPEAAASDANLASSPSRDQVIAAMNSVKPAVQACAKGESGIATVSVSVAGATGRVTTAQVNGVAGPSGSCIAQAVRKAQFPKFKSAVFKIAYPFKL